MSAKLIASCASARTMLVDGFETIVGGARYAFDSDNASIEFGLSMNDRWQGHGIGKALLKNLECRRGVVRAPSAIFGDTLRSNDAMIVLARKSGYAFANTPGDWKLTRFQKQIHVEPQEIPCASWRLAAISPAQCPRLRLDKTEPGSGHPEPGLSMAGEHRLALVDKRLHGFLVIGRHLGSDHALGLMVARGGEIEHQGFVEIVLHIADRDRRSFGDRFGEREGFRLQFVVGDHAVHQADRLAFGGIDPFASEHQFPRARCADQPCQEPGDAIIAAQAHLEIAGGKERRLRGDSYVAGHCQSEAGADRGAGQGGNGRLAHRDQRAGQETLPLLQIGDPLVMDISSFFLSRFAPMPLTLPPAQNAVPAPVSNSTPTSGFSPQALIMLRKAGVRLSDNALRASGRFSVMMATRSRITQSSSSVPVSILVSVVMSLPLLLLLLTLHLFWLRHSGARSEPGNLEIPGLVLRTTPE